MTGGRMAPASVPDVPSRATHTAPRAVSAVVCQAIRLLCRVVLRVLRVAVHTRGAVPAAPALILSNHLGWLDILAILARHDCSVVAKQEVRAWPIIGWLAERFGVVWVDRRRKRDLLRAIPALEQTLRSGRSVLLFPEGTTSTGDRLLPFKSALVEAAVRARVPVVPLALTGSVTAGDAAALCWIDDETLVANLPRLLALQGAALVVHAAPAIGPGPTRKVMTALARAAIAQRTRDGAIRPAPPPPPSPPVTPPPTSRRVTPRRWRPRSARPIAGSFAAFVAALLIGVSMLYAAAPIYRFSTPEPFRGDRWYNPYDGVDPRARWLRTNLHAHSTAWGGLTNGRQSATTVAAAYRALDYDITGISNYHVDPSLRPAGTFPVYEHGWNVRKSHHLAIGANAVLWLDLPFGATRHQQQYLLDRLHATAPLIAIAHPSIRRARSAADLAALSGYELLEVLNHFAPPADSLWDAALSSGRAVWLLASDDSHDITGRGETGTNVTFVQAATARDDDVIDALRRGAMYGVRAPRGVASLSLRALSITGDTLRITAQGPIREARIVSDGGQVRAHWRRERSTDTTVSLQLVAQASDSYLRVVLEGHDQLLYTNPVVRWDGRDLSRGAAVIDGPRTAIWRAAWILAYAWFAAWLIGNLVGEGRVPAPRETPSTL
jgi:1-acyl-sn-glycerol-3-phosphate acyltransferase